MPCRCVTLQPGWAFDVAPVILSKVNVLVFCIFARNVFVVVICGIIAYRGYKWVVILYCHGILNPLVGMSQGIFFPLVLLIFCNSWYDINIVDHVV